MKKLVVIGGGENGRLLEDGTYAKYDTESIDREIVRLTNKISPNFLFIGHAMNFSKEIQESYFQTMKKIYGDIFNCNCQDLKSDDLYNRDLVKEKISWADIIYEGGGDTLSMIKLWKKTGFDKILYSAWLDGKVICGISAGAACWFNSCNSEVSNNNYKEKFKQVNCLNWIDAHLTPHANERGRSEATKQQLLENKKIGILLPNCMAIEVIDENYRILTSDNSNSVYAYKVFWTKKNYNKVKIKKSEEFENINVLLEIKDDNCEK